MLIFTEYSKNKINVARFFDSILDENVKPSESYILFFDI